MKYIVSKQIYKDIKNIDKYIIRNLCNVLEEIKNAVYLSDIKNVKKIVGYTNFYRIRIGEYRLGIEYDNETVSLKRFLHRREVYKYFP